jgi:hypothetical protein
VGEFDEFKNAVSLQLRRSDGSNAAQSRSHGYE